MKSCDFFRLIWLGTILPFRRNNQGTLLPYHERSRRNDMTQRLKVVSENYQNSLVIFEMLMV